MSHEVGHEIDRLESFFPAYFPNDLKERFSTELKSYRLESVLNQALGTTTRLNLPGMTQAQREAEIAERAQGSVDIACKKGGLGCK